MEFESRVRLADLTRGRQPRPGDAVSVTLEAQLVRIVNMIDTSSTDRNAGHALIWSFDERSKRTANQAYGVVGGGVGIMTVDAFAVTAHGQHIFDWIVHAGAPCGIMA